MTLVSYLLLLAIVLVGPCLALIGSRYEPVQSFVDGFALVVVAGFSLFVALPLAMTVLGLPGLALVVVGVLVPLLLQRLVRVRWMFWVVMAFVCVHMFFDGVWLSTVGESNALAWSIVLRMSVGFAIVLAAQGSRRPGVFMVMGALVAALAAFGGSMGSSIVNVAVPSTVVAGVGALVSGVLLRLAFVPPRPEGAAQIGCVHDHHHAHDAHEHDCGHHAHSHNHEEHHKHDCGHAHEHHSDCDHEHGQNTHGHAHEVHHRDHGCDGQHNHDGHAHAHDNHHDHEHHDCGHDHHHDHDGHEHDCGHHAHSHEAHHKHAHHHHTCDDEHEHEHGCGHDHDDCGNHDHDHHHDHEHQDEHEHVTHEHVHHVHTHDCQHKHHCHHDAHDHHHDAHGHEHHHHGVHGCEHDGDVHTHDCQHEHHEHDHHGGHDHHHHHERPSLPSRIWATVGVLIGLAFILVGATLAPDAMVSRVPIFLRTLGVLVLESAPALLLGYALAGVVPFLLTPSRTTALGRGGKLMQSLRGVAFGLPLPVCSCGVLPLYESLIRRGAPPAAALAFFVATPELGLDAVLLSVPLLGSSLTIARVVAAFAVAVLVALLVSRRTDTAKNAGDENVVKAANEAPWLVRVRSGLRFGFVDVFDHTMPWIALGLIVAAFAEPMLSHGSIAKIPTLLQVPLAAVVGVPIYVCASGATPIAALAMHKGLSAGAAIAFLIAGPATNITTFGVLSRLHSRRTAFLFGLSVTVMAVIAGWVVDLIGVSASDVLTPQAHVAAHGSWFAWGCLVCLVLLTVASLVRQGPRSALNQILEPIHSH